MASQLWQNHSNSIPLIPLRQIQKDVTFLLWRWFLKLAVYPPPLLQGLLLSPINTRHELISNKDGAISTRYKRMTWITKTESSKPEEKKAKLPGAYIFSLPLFDVPLGDRHTQVWSGYTWKEHPHTINK